MAIVKLRAGETVLVSAVVPGLAPGGGPMPGGDSPVDPGYGIDLGLGYLRPTHPIALPPGGGTTPGTPPPRPHPEPPPLDPGYGIDEDTGWVHPDHTLPIPPPPVDPGFDIDEILGWLRPGGGPILPPDQPPPDPIKWEVRPVWTPAGWIVVGIPTGEHVTPSRK